MDTDLERLAEIHAWYMEWIESLPMDAEGRAALIAEMERVYRRERAQFGAVLPEVLPANIRHP